MPGFAHTSKSFCDCAPNTHYLTSYRVLLSALTPGWTNTTRNWEGIGCCSPLCRACTWACWEAPRAPCQLGHLHTAPAARAPLLPKKGPQTGQVRVPRPRSQPRNPRQLPSMKACTVLSTQLSKCCSTRTISLLLLLGTMARTALI